MGKNTKLASTGKGKAHAAGASVAVTQFLVHDPLGTIGYLWPVHWACHANLAHSAFERLTELHADIEAIEPSADNTRLVANEALIVEAYGCGGAMVSNAVRSVQHLAQAMTTQSKTALAGGTVADRIKEATAALNIDCHLEHSGYPGFSEMVGIRDAIEHPQDSNVYQVDQNAWDKVPLAWILSDRSLTAYTRYREWLNTVAVGWQKWLDANAQPMTLTVERGVVSRYPARKPRRRMT